MVYEFDGEIRMLEGKMKWKVVYFPHITGETFGTNGKVPIQVTVDGHDFEHTLLPSKNGHYFVYNELMRRAVGKELGDSVHVTLKENKEIRQVVLPEYIENVLQNQKVLNAFLGQPDYMKREQIQFIELAKKEETRHNRIAALCSRLQ
ncbi:hypothetical protein D3C75_878790 [compost metagenome]